MKKPKIVSSIKVVNLNEKKTKIFSSIKVVNLQEKLKYYLRLKWTIYEKHLIPQKMNLGL